MYARSWFASSRREVLEERSARAFSSLWMRSVTVLGFSSEAGLLPRTYSRRERRDSKRERVKRTASSYSSIASVIRLRSVCTYMCMYVCMYVYMQSLSRSVGWPVTAIRLH